MKTHTFMAFVLIILVQSHAVLAQAEVQLWHYQTKAPTYTAEDKLRAKAKDARHLTLDVEQLKTILNTHVKEYFLQLPLPNGESVNFTLTPSPILSRNLAVKYPNLMTYEGHQVDDPNNYGRFSLSPQGFFGFFRVANEWLLLSPQLRRKTDHYLVYRYSDAIALNSNETTLLKKSSGPDFLNIEPINFRNDLSQKPAPTGDQIRTYRLAVSTTGEYAQKISGNTDTSNIADVVAEIMILVNRINQILLSDLAVQFELVDNEAIIFTDADTDPYTNDDAASDIDINQGTLDNLIGPENYDIGHLLSTTGGGIAGVGVACRADSKALGTSGTDGPLGERFYIDLVAHEFGHQLGAHHSFNAQDANTCDDSQRFAQTAFEPGSGSTIMSYPGLCDGQNLQNQSDPYFHAGSIEEIRNYVTGFTGRSCGTLNLKINAIPQIQLLKSNYIIPANTPFVLSGSASDTDAESISYSWEQVNAGGTEGGTANASAMTTDNGNNPLFRSYPSSSSAERYFPALSSVLDGQLVFGETYATTNRELTFRLTVRDNNGGVNSSDIALTVVNNEQEFSLIQPNGPLTWEGLSKQTVSWNPADTQLAPYNCKNVDILMNSELNSNVMTPVALAVVNDGEEIITVPNITTTQGRLIVKCSDNVFYAVNNANLHIVSIEPPEPIQPIIVGQQVLNIPEDTEITVSLNDLIVADADANYPSNFTLSLQSGSNYSVNNTQVIPAENFNGQLIINITVNDGGLESPIFALMINVTAVNDAPHAVNDAVNLTQNAAAGAINVLSNDTDIDSNELIISSINYNGQGIANIRNQQITYQPANGFIGVETMTYTVSDGQLSSEGTLTINVLALPATPNSSSSGGGSLSFFLMVLLLVLTLTGLLKRSKVNV